VNWGVLKEPIEIAKGVVALVLSIAPLLGAKVYPDINPKIIDDVRGRTALVMGIAGLACYVITRARTGATWPGVAGIVLCLASLIAHEALISGVLTASPSLASLLARLFFVGFFVGIASTIGWGMARLLPRPSYSG
jgi:hypothetical protein